MNLKFCGTRGSYPVCGEQYTEYGEGTTCVLLSFNETKIMVDCGTGVSAAEEDLKDADTLYLFISHIHLDHISGISTLVTMFMGKKIHVYCKTRNGISVKDAFDKIMSPPLWPVTPEMMADITYHEIPENEFTDESPLVIDDVKITTMESNHVGGCTLYRFDELNDDKESLTTAFDYNHSPESDERLKAFAAGTHTLIYDGAMTEEMYERFSTWGHSTPEHGAELAKEIGVKALYIIHHSNRTDREISAHEERLRSNYPFAMFAKTGMHKDRLSMILDIGMKLSSEKDNDRLLELIIRAAMDITGADGGTLYLCEDDGLHFKIMITKSMSVYKGGKGETIELPPVPYSIKNVCAAAKIEGRLINIPDVYNSDEYDFSGPRRYDQMTGYKTTSVMVVPMENDYGEIIGVLQLINATDEIHRITEFTIEDEQIVATLASQTAVCLTNMNYSRQVVDLLYSFVRVISTGIDARTPYNANHTRNMVKYCNRFFDYQNEINGPYAIPESERREILISVWLHDIGKLITPLEVMDKSTRLGDSLGDVENRFGRMRLLAKLNGLGDEKLAEIADDLEFIKSINAAGFLPDEKLERVNELAKKTYVEEDGSTQPILLEDEIKRLSIRKGTLTDEERSIMQSHVVMTDKMLSELDFPRGFEDVRTLAASHHEHLNGKGYPNGLDASQLSWKSRLITILDVFEALTAKDRPYKPPMPVEKAFGILDAMVKDGQVDNDILTSFKESQLK